MAKALRERVGKQYKGTQRTRKAVHGQCAVELAKWTFPIISLCHEPYEAKVSRTGLTGGMGRRTVRQRALCLPSFSDDPHRTHFPSSLVQTNSFTGSDIGVRCTPCWERTRSITSTSCLNLLSLLLPEYTSLLI